MCKIEKTSAASGASEACVFPQSFIMCLFCPDWRKRYHRVFVALRAEQQEVVARVYPAEERPNVFLCHLIEAHHRIPRALQVLARSKSSQNLA